MRNPIRGATPALILIITVFILTGCATVKSTGNRQSHTLTGRMKSGTTAGATGERSDVTARRTGELLQGQTTSALTLERIPASEATVDVPIQNLLDLPEGAGYTARDGRARVSVQRHGDNIAVTGECDSIARRCLFYEREAFRQRGEADSLKQVISRMEQASSRSDETCRAESDAVETERKKTPSTWYKWLLAGFVGGLSLTSPLKKLKNRVLTFLK